MMGLHHISRPSLAVVLLSVCVGWYCSQVTAQSARKEGDGDGPTDSVFPQETLEETIFSEMLRIVDQKFDSLSARISGLERSVNSLNFYSVRQFREIAENIEASTITMETLRSQIGKQDKDDRILKAAVSQASRDINVIKTKVSTLENDVSAVTSGVTVTKSNVDELKSDSLKMFEDIANSIVYFNENVEEKTEELRAMIKEMIVADSDPDIQKRQGDMSLVIGYLQGLDPARPRNCTVNFGPLEERIDLRFAEMKRQTHFHFVDLINAGGGSDSEEEEEEEEKEESAPQVARQTGQRDPDQQGTGSKGSEEEREQRDGEKVMRLLANMTQNVMEAVAYFRHTGGMMERLLHSAETMAEEQTRLRYDVLEATGLLSAHTRGAELLFRNLGGNAAEEGQYVGNPPGLSAQGSALSLDSEEQEESNLLGESSVDTGHKDRLHPGFSRPAPLGSSPPYTLGSRGSSPPTEAEGKLKEVAEESLRVLSELTKNGSQVLDVMTELAQHSSNSLTRAVGTLQEEVEKLRDIGKEWREGVTLSSEASSDLTAAAQDTTLTGDLVSLHNTTKTIFSIVEAIASNTGWIPYIFHNMQHVERLANRTLELTKRSLLTLHWNRSHGSDITTPLAQERRHLVQGSMTQAEALDVIYDTNMKLQRIMPALTKLLAEPEPLIALAEGQKSHEGRVEVFHKGQWGTVCRMNMGHEEASKVCQQLGYSGGVWAGPDLFARGIERYLQLNVSCVSSHLCPYLVRSNQTVDCPTGHFGVICDHMLRMTPIPGLGEVKSGLVSLHHQGRWLPVCSHGWSGYEARVACKQMGFLDGRELVQEDMNWRQILGDIHTWVSGIGCTGEEVRLDACKVDSYKATECTGSGTPAAVRCQ